MDRLRNIFQTGPVYEPLDTSAVLSEAQDEDQELDQQPPAKPQFSWIEYGIFFILGIAMLWAW